jgi:hypothetical protein
MWPRPSPPATAPLEGSAECPLREGEVQYLVPGPDGELVPASKEDMAWILAYERERAEAAARLSAARPTRAARRGWLAATMRWVRRHAQGRRRGSGGADRQTSRAER